MIDSLRKHGPQFIGAAQQTLEAFMAQVNFITIAFSFLLFLVRADSERIELHVHTIVYANNRVEVMCKCVQRCTSTLAENLHMHI